MPVLREFEGRIAIHIDYGGTPPVHLDLWTGEGDLTFPTVDGRTYRAGRILDIGDASITGRNPIQAASFSISVTEAEQRTFQFRSDRGLAPVEMRWLWRLDDTDPWKEAMLVAGRIASQRYERGALSIEVREQVHDVDRGETLLMDNATQQRLHAGDMGFGYTADIAGHGGIRKMIAWPT